MSKREKDVLLNILEFYREMPYLWDRTHADYKNTLLRSEGFRELLELYKTIDPDATIKTIKKKIENMRAAYYRELKKVESAKYTGEGTEEYVPTLWYYDSLTFMRPSTESCYFAKETGENEDLSSEEDNSQAGPSNPVFVPKKKKLSLEQKQESILKAAVKMMATKDEDWEVFGKSIGLQLRDLKKQDLTIAQKLISDVIYYAKIGRLTEDAYVSVTLE